MRKLAALRALLGGSRGAVATISGEPDEGAMRHSEASLEELCSHRDQLEERLATRSAELAESHRARSLEARQRDRAEADLRRTVDELQFLLRTREELEQRVAERTRELEEANRRLADEVVERRRVEAELRSALGRLDGFMNNTPLAVIERLVPDDGSEPIIIRWMGQAQRLFGFTAEAVLGRTIHDVGIIPPERLPWARNYWQGIVAREERQSQLTVPNLTMSGERRICTWYHSFIWNDGPGRGRVLSLVEDVTERTQAFERAEWLARHDPLTGLPNRALFYDRLLVALANARRRGDKLAVMLIDVDQFKAVNDRLGHLAGDELLRELAERLASCARETDTVARLGGDEFAIIQTGLDRPDAVWPLADRLLAAAARPLQLEGTSLSPTISVGVALSPADGETPEAIVRNADQALYRAKRSGPGRCVTFDPLQDREANLGADPGATAAPTVPDGAPQARTPELAE